MKNTVRYLTIYNEDRYATAKRLLEIARVHVRLALEHSQTNTTPDRRRAIMQDIERLRAERDALLTQSVATATDKGEVTR